MSHTATDLNQAAADLTHAFNDADWDRFRNRLAPELVYNETGTGRRAEGVDAYLALCQGWKEAMPDVSGTIRKSVAADGTVAQEVLWEGTHTGPLQTPAGTIEATGNRVSAHTIGAGLRRVCAGRLLRSHRAPRRRVPHRRVGQPAADRPG